MLNFRVSGESENSGSESGGDKVSGECASMCMVSRGRGGSGKS